MPGRGEASPYDGTNAVCLLPCFGPFGAATIASRMSSRRSWRNVR
jgi:hypothetical protein